MESTKRVAGRRVAKARGVWKLFMKIWNSSAASLRLRDLGFLNEIRVRGWPGIKFGHECFNGGKSLN